MQDPEQKPPQPPANGGRVVSIVGELGRRRRKHARDRHLRAVELAQEMADNLEALEELDLDGALAASEVCSTVDARISRALVRTLRGLRRCLTGDTAAGFADWAEAIVEAPEAGTAYLYRARWSMQTDPASALDDFDRAVAAEPSNPALYAGRGDCLAALGDPDRALANYRRTVALEPMFFDAHYFMARIFAARGEHAEARAAYDRAIRLAPSYVDFYLARAHTLEQLGDFTGARGDYDRIRELDPSWEDPRSHLGAGLGPTGDVSRALDGLTEIVSEDPSSDPGASELLIAIGTIRLATGRQAEAIADFSRALALAPDDVAACARRGRAYFETGEHDRALEDFDRALALAPEDAEHHVSRANALARLGRGAEAVLALSRAIALAPNHALAHALRAIHGSHLAEDKEGFARVKADLGRAVELAPNDVSYRRRRGEYLMHLGEVTAALVDLERAIALAPDVAALHYDRGYCKSMLATEGYDPDHDEPEEDRQARCRSALADLERAVALGLRTEEVHVALVSVRQQMRDEEGLLAALDVGLAAVPDAFTLLSLRHGRRRRRGDVEGAAADRAHLVALGFPVHDGV